MGLLPCTNICIARMFMVVMWAVNSSGVICWKDFMATPNKRGEPDGLHREFKNPSRLAPRGPLP
jgi:hypothetical protein